MVTALQNEKHILIGDNSYEFGRILSVFLNEKGFKVVCRRNDTKILKNEIISLKPDVAVICIYNNDCSSINLISEIKASGCHTKIIAVSYCSNNKICRHIIDSGAERCIIMPDSMTSICNMISEVASSSNYIAFEPEIRLFLISKGIPNHLKGFSYLVTAVGLCVTDPRNVSDITGNLYRLLAEIYNTTTIVIERSIRHIASLAHENGSDSRLADCSPDDVIRFDTSLTNYELICLASDTFCKKYQLYR